ncbi:non-specific lipid transfer protein GPI-anchored 3-like [Nymphaea colorata]|nr:non-specific lipid transfer protein GPI-anchored 3-like [Nymphaea colorata]
MEKGVGGRVAVLMVVVAAAAAMVGMGGRGVSAQGTSTCVNDLVVCQKDISNASTKPDSKCCSALNNAVSKELSCLCDLYKQDTIFQTLGLNKTRAMELPGLCGIKAGLSLCNTTSATPPSSATPSPSSTPGAGSGSNSSSGATKLGWGVTPWWALVLLPASLIGL